MHLRRLVGVVLVVLVVAAGCGGGSSKAKPAKPAVQSTALGTGVTANEVKIGISLSDFNCIKQFVDAIRVGQTQIYQAFIDHINKHGGVAGRQIKPVFDTFCPIPNAQLLAQVCTKFAEDEKVFAVLGNMFDPSGEAQTCLAKRHKTILFAFMLTEQIIDKSPPGLMIYAGTNPERTDAVLGQLLKQNHSLDGKKVAILGESSTAKAVRTSVTPTLQKLGVELGSTAILQIAGPDTTSAQAQLDSFVERWKSEHVDALFVSGTEVSSKQFIEKVRKEMPNVILMTDNTDVLRFGREEAHAHRNPNPYEGILTAAGPTAHEYDQSENWKYCADIYKEQTGKDAPNEEAVIPAPGGGGKTLDTYGSINDACQLLSLFQTVGNKVGQYLNIDNWASTVDTFGPIVNRGGGQFASLHKGKYDIDDTFRLEAFDSTLPGDGNWKPITDLQNIPGS